MNPADPDAQRDLSIRCDVLGDILRTMGRAEDSLRYYEHSLRIARGLLSTAPDDRQLRSDVAASLERVAWALNDVGRGVEALERLREQARILVVLVREEPGDGGLRQFLASTYLSLGRQLESLGRLEEARVCLDEAIAHYGAALDALPWTADLCNAVGMARVLAGRLAVRAGDVPSGLRHLGDAVTWMSHATSSAPSDVAYARWQVAALEELAVAEQKAGDARAARTHAALAVALRRRAPH